MGLIMRFIIGSMRINGTNQRKLGSNTSVLRTNRIVRLDLDEGWCETLHYITIHRKRIDLDERRCVTLHYITPRFTLELSIFQ